MNRRLKFFLLGLVGILGTLRGTELLVYAGLSTQSIATLFLGIVCLLLIAKDRLWKAVP